MKRLLMVIIVLASCALSAVSIRSIQAENYNGLVCRLVLRMDQDVDFKVNKQGNDFFIAIDDFDGQLPAFSLSGTFLDQIELADGGIKVSSEARLRYLTMRLSDVKALVIDFIKFSQSKKERLFIASFLIEKGLLGSADRAYEEIARDYPNHYDVYYHWGDLLLQRGSSRAVKKLGMIPDFSSYYPLAQDLLHGVRNSSRTDRIADKIPEPQEQEVAIIHENVELQIKTKKELEPNALSPQDSIVFFLPSEGNQAEGSGFFGSIAELANRYFLLIIALAVALAVFLLFLILGRFRKPAKKPHQDIQESNLGIDTDTLCKMVHRLLADGWTNKEIARELKINQQEVELMVRRLHYMGVCEDDDK